MSLPENIDLGNGVVLSKTFIPGEGVTQRTYIAASGERTDLVIIQSAPTKAGRQRHVIRRTATSAPNAVTGARTQSTMTVTFDHPVEDTNYAGLASVYADLGNVLNPERMTAVLAGQQ